MSFHGLPGNLQHENGRCQPCPRAPHTCYAPSQTRTCCMGEPLVRNFMTYFHSTISFAHVRCLGAHFSCIGPRLQLRLVIPCPPALQRERLAAAFLAYSTPYLVRSGLHNITTHCPNPRLAALIPWRAIQITERRCGGMRHTGSRKSRRDRTR